MKSSLSAFEDAQHEQYNAVMQYLQCRGEQLSSRRVLLVSWMIVEPLGEEISVTSKGRRLHHDDMRSNWRSWRKKSNEIETPPLGVMRD